jgi:hypothetical protein
MATDWDKAREKAFRTGQWAVRMTKVRIRQVSSRTRWEFVTFSGKSGGESRGVVDLVAIRKDHRTPKGVLNRGDALQIVLVQVKGGAAARPTPSGWKRLKAVEARHGAADCLLAVWKKGRAVEFFRPSAGTTGKRLAWSQGEDVEKIFR